jgi:hypothetical protein
MSYDRDEFRDQMSRCLFCGSLCDGDLCDEMCESGLAEVQEAEQGMEDDDDE